MIDKKLLLHYCTFIIEDKYGGGNTMLSMKIIPTLTGTLGITVLRINHSE